MSSTAQDAFRGVIETYANNCRFILTCNYPEKLMEPIKNRLEVYDYNSFSKQEMVKPIFQRLKAILENENVTYDPKELVPVINTYYPSIRSMIGALQKFSTDGVFSVKQSELDSQDAYMVLIDLVLKKDFNSMVNTVNELSSPDNMYTFIYKNINKFPNMPGTIMTVAKYQFQASSVRDKNLNLSACLTELMQ